MKNNIRNVRAKERKDNIEQELSDYSWTGRPTHVISQKRRKEHHFTYFLFKSHFTDDEIKDEYDPFDFRRLGALHLNKKCIEAAYEH